MACENAPKKQKVAITLVRRDALLSDLQKLICSLEAPSKAWFQDQEETARRHTSSAAPMIEDDDDDVGFKPIPVVNQLPGTFLALLFRSSN
jgi:hypothetical protein